MSMLHDPDVGEIRTQRDDGPAPPARSDVEPIVIRLCDDVIDRMHGHARVREAFGAALGIGIGETTADGRFRLERTSCIGMSDQAPAALIGGVVVTRLTPDRAREIVSDLREHDDLRRLTRICGRGNNAHELVHSMVRNHIQTEGIVLLSPVSRGEGLRRALDLDPDEVAREITASGLRGRGGAGFPCGAKWAYARAAARPGTVVVATMDEEGPGTFKDRVLLTEFPDRIFAGMTIAGYAIGATEGILCLREEYAYLRPLLEHVLEKRRRDGLLGPDVMERHRLAFDVTIRTERLPAPGHAPCLDVPLCANNVETLCCATKILEDGAASFLRYGTAESPGTKLLSISGDCRKPGTFEVPFGLTVEAVLDLCGGENAIAVQVGGPAGRMVGPQGYAARIAYEDLPTGGSIMVFGPGRNLLAVVHALLAWFEEQGCETCTACRAGTGMLREGLERIMAGRMEPSDMERLLRLARTMRSTSRCWLGRTAPGPLLSSYEALPALYAHRTTPISRRLRREAEAESGNA